MKKSLFIFLGLTMLFTGIARAEERPVNLALVDPVQIVDSTNDIKGFRLNLLYGKNQFFTGLDLGIGVGHSQKDFGGVGLHYGGNFVQGNAKGLQLANIINLDMGDFTGVQFAGANYTQGNTKALQLGYASITQGNFSGAAIGGANIVNQNGKGFKLAIFNLVSQNFSGLQIGLVNIAGLENAVQIGLININKNKKPLPFFPFVNFSF
jgi:uncharacterized protein YjbI with pentapeptide repeats